MHYQKSEKLEKWARDYVSTHGPMSRRALGRVIRQSDESVGEFQAENIARKALNPPKEKKHGNCLLDMKTEAVLVTYLQLRSENFEPIPCVEFGNIVRTILHKSESWKSKSFVDSFLKRHKNFISVHRGKEITLARCHTNLFDSCKDFCEHQEQFLKTHYFPADVTFNVDESQLDLHSHDVCNFFDIF
jgi:16S rRNA A1518/A1519 N6-dimethyltransferase RsmA/KsgA/DIM1 with predicted DNA glycosylase/AP lyase activity